MLTGGGNGSGSDLLGRVFGEFFKDRTGQVWVMDNRPGASSAIASTLAKQAAPDGYTFYLTQVAAFAVAPHAMKEVNYDPIKDFEHVAKLVSATSVLFVRKDNRNLDTLADLIAFARKNPGKLSYAVAGVGTSTNMSIALIKQKLGLDMVMVPYKSSADPLMSVVKGETDFSVAIAQVVGARQDIKPLAVTAGRRSTRLPNVATIAELAIPGYDITTWFGISAPKGVSRPIVDRMSAIIKAAGENPKTKDDIYRLGSDIDYLDSAAFTQFVAAEFKKWGPIVAVSGVPKE
jgi:tripartite-type tricarboxylate transporter receptor subunit TctC